MYYMYYMYYIQLIILCIKISLLKFRVSKQSMLIALIDRQHFEAATVDFSVFMVKLVEYHRPFFVKRDLKLDFLTHHQKK